MISISPLKKAHASLTKALNEPVNEYVRDAAIRRFEYTYELSWKLLKRYLNESAGITEHNIKNIFREAAKQDLIENLELWFEFHEARNLTSHTYNEKNAEEAYHLAQQFAPAAAELIARLEQVIE